MKAGETLVALDDREARAAMVQGEAAAVQAEARLCRLHELTLPSADEAPNPDDGDCTFSGEHLNSVHSSSA